MPETAPKQAQHQQKRPSISFAGDVQVFERKEGIDDEDELDDQFDDEIAHEGNGRDHHNDVEDEDEDEDDGYFVSHHYHEQEQPPGITVTPGVKKVFQNTSPGSSPSRTPAGTYAPPRTPQGAVAKKSSLKKSSSSFNQPTSEERKRESQEKYIAQEEAYVRKLTKNMMDDAYDYEGAPLVIGDDYYDDDRIDSEDETNDELAEAVGLGGVGTSFDDEYTDLGSSYPFLEMGYTLNDLSSLDEGLRERLEWQAMLSSVLTGEVVQSEKRRLKAPQSQKAVMDNDLWIGIRARVCGRSVEEQQRIVDYARAHISHVFENFWNFRIEYTDESSLESVSEQVDSILQQVEKIEGLWKSLKAMRAECVPYGDDDFQRRLGALTAWSTITASISQEFDLLRQWTGNVELDPTIPPARHFKNEELPSLVESILKQDDLERLFENRIQRTMDPLIKKARDATVEFSEIYVELGLPLFHERLSHLMQFPIKMIQEVIRMRLVYARRLVNPTMMIVNQIIGDLGKYIRLATTIMQRNQEYTSPIFDKGWVFPNHADESFNTTVLDCLRHYLDLLQQKFLRDSKSASRMYLTFKETDQLEQQYAFLKDVGSMIRGADLVIAEQFSSLETKMLSRLYTYWEGQMKGPQQWNTGEVDKWFATTIENVRSFQRKLLRFYKILCTTYENSTEYSIQSSKIKGFVESLRQSGHFLVYTGAFEKYGVYTIADPSLSNQPEKIRSILKGYCRSDNLLDEEDANSYLLILCIREPLVWEGDIVNLDIPYSDIELEAGRMRLVSVGKTADLKQTRKQLARACGGTDAFDVVVENRSHLKKVNHELSRIRKMFFRLAGSVISSATAFRSQLCQHGCLNKPGGCQETVQNMFVFAREFGQRGIHVMDANRKGNVAMKLINLAIEWVSFICDDCVPTDYKTFRWTVVALEFAMVMTRGVNITAIDNKQFANLRQKVAQCMTLLISHFDIMGARSKAAERQKNLEAARRIKMMNIHYKDDDELMTIFREEALKKIATLEENRQIEHGVSGKVLDDTNTDSEFLTFLQSSFSKMSIRWQQGQFIGGGSFGSVYAAVNLDTGGVMAVKEIRLHDNSHIRRGLKSITDEMTALEMLSHPNIVQYYGVEVHRDKVFIFMEYCQGGSLADLLEYGRIEDEQVIQVYTLQMLEGLAYLHSSGIVHRDIKPENILLDHMGVVKFVDFGGAKVIAKTGKTKGRHSTRLNSMTGTPMYMSPEVITGADQGRHGSIDIWSTGCCVLEMATGRRPWANLDNDWAVMYHIAAGHLPQLPSEDQLSADGIDFLMKCLQRDPLQRQSAVELLRDPWIQAISMQLIGDPSVDDNSVGSSNNNTPTSTGIGSPVSSAASNQGSVSSQGGGSNAPSRDLSQVQAAARSITYSYSSQQAAAAAAAAAAATANQQLAPGMYSPEMQSMDFTVFQQHHQQYQDNNTPPPVIPPQHIALPTTRTQGDMVTPPPPLPPHEHKKRHSGP